MTSSTVGAQPSFSTLAILTNEPVVSVDCLHANIRDPDLKGSGSDNVKFDEDSYGGSIDGDGKKRENNKVKI
uniref:Uncharacterized protein n=1 Tax=Solanum lycopersicum TaxID=4081 RepID=A0A3Q7HKB2_SOLLC